MNSIRYGIGVALAIGVLSSQAPAADWPGPPPTQVETPPAPPFPPTDTPDDTPTTPTPVSPPTDNPAPGTGQPPGPTDDGPGGPPVPQESPEPATLGLALIGAGAFVLRRKRR